MHTALRSSLTIALVALGVVFGTVCGGCTNKAPTLDVAAPTIIDQTPEGTVVQFAINATNPNNDALNLLELRYEVKVNGKTTFRGRRAAQTTLSRQASGTVLVPAVVPDAAMGWTADTRPSNADISINGVVTYIAPDEIAKILYDTRVQRPRVGFNAHGTVALDRSVGATTE